MDVQQTFEKSLVSTKLLAGPWAFVYYTNVIKPDDS